MVEFQQTMDPESMAVVRNGIRIGSLMWHKSRAPRFVNTMDNFEFDLDELRQVTEKLAEKSAQ